VTKPAAAGYNCNLLFLYVISALRADITYKMIGECLAAAG